MHQLSTFSSKVTLHLTQITGGHFQW